MVEKNVESDLGLKSEMSMAIANLVNMEEHLSMTVASTGDIKHLEVLSEIRKLRANYMKQYVGNVKLRGQLWCFLKHTFATAYRLTEVSTKNFALGNKDEAVNNLKDAKDLLMITDVILQIEDGNARQLKVKN